LSYASFAHEKTSRANAAASCSLGVPQEQELLLDNFS